MRGLPVSLVLVVVLGALGRAEPPGRAPQPETPEAVLGRYLAALKAERFDEVWELSSRAMRRGRDKTAYVKEAKALAEVADVKIFDFTVGKGTIEQDRARVPNILESQDRFVNTLGLTEYELYTLVREDGGWKVDSQILLEPHQVSTWFPERGSEAKDRASH